MSTDLSSDTKLPGEPAYKALSNTYNECTLLIDKLYDRAGSSDTEGVIDILEKCATVLPLKVLTCTLEIAAWNSTPLVVTAIITYCHYILDSKSYTKGLLAATHNPDKRDMLSTIAYGIDEDFCGKDVVHKYIDRGDVDKIDEQLIKDSCHDNWPILALILGPLFFIGAAHCMSKTQEYLSGDNELQDINYAALPGVVEDWT